MKIPESEYQNIANLYDAGKTQTFIGQQYRVSHTYIGQILKKINHPTRVGCSRVYREEVKVNHQYVLEAYNEGFSYSQIAEDIGITSATVIYVLQQKGVWQESRYKFDYLRDGEKLAIAYQFGMSISSIKAKFRCHESTVTKALKEFEVSARKRWDTVAKKGKCHADQYAELYKYGYSCQEIANELGCSKQNVDKLIRKYYPEIMRSRGKALKQKKRNAAKLVNSVLMESDKYNTLVSHSALRRDK
jgi:transposase